LPIGLAAKQLEECTLRAAGLIDVLFAGLQKHNINSGVLAQPRGDDRAGGSGTDDDVMGTGHRRSLLVVMKKNWI
jgi:hypothetical protein